LGGWWASILCTDESISRDDDMHFKIFPISECYLGRFPSGSQRYLGSVKITIELCSQTFKICIPAEFFESKIKPPFF
jgi:hypothetical protein